MNRGRQTSRITPIVAALAAALVAGPALAEQTHQETIEKIEPLSQAGRLHLSNVAGRIDVMTWQEAQVKIQAVKTSRASTLSKATENAAKVMVEVIKAGDLVRVATQYPAQVGGRSGRDSVNVSVDYKVWVPQQASVELKSVSGDIRVYPLGGRARLNCVSGNVELLGAAGAEVELVSGDLTLENIGGDAHLKTVSGDIVAKAIGGAIEADTVSGAIELQGIADAQRVAAQSVSGNISYSGAIAPGGRYELTSHSGRVRMTAPADAAFELDASSFSGRIQSGFDVQSAGQGSRRELRGTVGAGGATVVLKSFSGRIALDKE